MKLSTRARYGIHAMYDLALMGNDKPQPLKAIAERQAIPEAYLEQLMLVLRKEKLVTSVRGAQGGYTLSKAPAEITVGMILRALEGDLCMTDCLKFEDSCEKSGGCPTRMVVQKVHDGVNAIVDGITLQDMIASCDCL
ncbi:MAG: Rrf2 family transcriptional regulator [Clostridia bacterium]|nr:Rrf2 family transcriptional regulator [Clostridia bacterium]